MPDIPSATITPDASASASSKSKFSPAEWDLLREAATLVESGVGSAAPSGPVGRFVEHAAAAMGIADATSASNLLLNELVSDESDFARTVDLDQDTRGLDSAQKRAYIIGVTMDTARNAAGIVGAKSTPEDAAAYKQWLYSIAEKSANAAREGFLSLAGPKVSADEQEFLGQLKIALGL